MKMSESDMAKINLLTVATQIHDLTAILFNINKTNLENLIDFIVPEERGSRNYRRLTLVLDFYNNMLQIHKEGIEEEEKNET